MAQQQHRQENNTNWRVYSMNKQDDYNAGINTEKPDQIRYKTEKEMVLGLDFEYVFGIFVKLQTCLFSPRLFPFFQLSCYVWWVRPKMSSLCERRSWYLCFSIICNTWCLLNTAQPLEKNKYSKMLHNGYSTHQSPCSINVLNWSSFCVHLETPVIGESTEAPLGHL